MKAVVFKGREHVHIEDRPIPEFIDPKNIILKVRYTALCGSQLHVFRGHQPSDTGFIVGHEFTGKVVKVGFDLEKVRRRFDCNFIHCQLWRVLLL